MSVKISIRVDSARDLVRIRMAGFFSPEDVTAFIHARAQAHAQLRCGPNQHLTLADLRGMKIQPQEAVAAFQAMLAQPEYRSRRLAFLIGTTLTRSQLIRTLAGRDGFRLFHSEKEAEAWLLEGDGVAQTIPRSAAA